MKTSSLFAIRYSLFAVATLAASSAVALDCAPYCDFTHDYGPYDLTWARPGLYAFPVCGPSGNCAPYAVHLSALSRRAHHGAAPQASVTSYQ